MAKKGIFKPFRGTKEKAGDMVLAKGELFLEIPEDGEGTGPGKMKMGDGTSPYSELPYFLGDGGGSGAVISATAPEDTSLLWIDTSSGVLKYHNGTAWVATKSTWG